METVSKTHLDAIVSAQNKWQKVPFVSLVIGLCGIVFWATKFELNPERAMYAYLFAFLSVLTLALGCLAFVLIQHLTRAGWSVLLRRVAEVGAATLPLFALLFVPIWILAADVFSWSHIEAGDAVLLNKASYLNLSSFKMRSAGYLILWALMGVWFYRTSVAQDDGNHKELSRKLWKMSASGIILFALSLSFASFDWLMSLQPHWYSTIFGVYFFAGAFLSGMALMTLVFLGLQRSGVLIHSVTAEHYQDLGKLMFGFTVFWAYIAFSQFMLYWYANVPEETEFYLQRLENGWQWMSYAIPFTNFFIPFLFLMSRHVKRNKIALATFCVWTIGVHFLDLYWVAMPNYGAHHLPEGVEAPHASFGLMEASILVGLLGLFFACMSFLLIRKSVAPIGDPRLKESMAFENS